MFQGNTDLNSLLLAHGLRPNCTQACPSLWRANLWYNLYLEILVSCPPLSAWHKGKEKYGFVHHSSPSILTELIFCGNTHWHFTDPDILMWLSLLSNERGRVVEWRRSRFKSWSLRSKPNTLTTRPWAGILTFLGFCWTVYRMSDWCLPHRTVMKIGLDGGLVRAGSWAFAVLVFPGSSPSKGIAYMHMIYLFILHRKPHVLSHSN